MGLVNGIVDHRKYIKRVFKQRKLWHTLEGINLEEIPDEQMWELHRIAVREEHAWYKSVLDVLNVKFSLNDQNEELETVD